MTSTTIDPKMAAEEVEDSVDNMEVTELEELIAELGIEGDVEPAMKGKKSKLRKFLTRYLIQVETDDADNGAAKYVQIYKYLEDKKDDKSKIKQSQTIVAANTSSTSPSTVTKQPDPPLKFDYDILRLKELKLNGTIGGTGKDKLTFAGLSYQIKNAEKAGFKEPAIVAAVVKSIAVENNLRTYFEGRVVDLTLKSLLATLRSYFKEKDSSHTLTELSRTAQKNNENTYDFAINLMCIRDKYIILAEQEEISYDKKNLWKRFLKSFMQGMRNANIRNELRECCRSEVEDQELLDLVAEAMSNETERLELLAVSKGGEVNVVSTESGGSNGTGSEKGKKEKGSPWVHIEELKLSHQQEIAAQNERILAMQNQMLANQAQLLEIKNAVIGNQQQPTQQSFQSLNPNAQTYQQTQNQIFQASQPNHAFQPPAQNFQAPGTRPTAPQTTPAQNVQQPYQPQNFPTPQTFNQTFQPQPFTQGHIPYFQRFNAPAIYKRPPGKCETCHKEQKPKCNHCFKCGSPDHRKGSPNCPKKD